MEIGSLRTANHLLNDPDALRRQGEQDGYLFIKSLIPAEEVLAVRSAVLKILAQDQLLASGTDPAAGLCDPDALDARPREDFGLCGVGVPDATYLAIQKLQSFHRLAHHPRLIELYGMLLGGDILPHPRNIARLMLPTRHNPITPPHQDYIHIQGTKNVWTCWFPLGDCPRELGGLGVLCGSHKGGLLPVVQAEGAGGLEAWICNQPYELQTTDFAAGDILTFTSLTVHRSLPNQTGNRARLSVDFRYQRADEEIEIKALETHCALGEWERIYQDWSEDDLKYYWRRYELKMADWDESIRWQKERIC